MSTVFCVLFHCFRHCSTQKMRPDFLKAWFLKGRTLLLHVEFGYFGIRMGTESVTVFPGGGERNPSYHDFVPTKISRKQ